MPLKQPRQKSNCLPPRLISEVQKHVTQSDVPTPEAKPEMWDDFVPDFWELKLPHFRQRAYVYSRSTSTCQVGGLFLDIRGALAGMLDRQNSHSSEILNDLIHYSSETNLLVGDSGDENEVMSSGLPSLPPSPQKPPSEEGEDLLFAGNVCEFADLCPVVSFVVFTSQDLQGTL